MLILADQIDDTRQKRIRVDLGNDCTRTQEEATVFIEMIATRLFVVSRDL